MQRLVPFVLIIVLASCTGLGREINQALPEFLRSDPGKQEMAILGQVRQARNWSQEDLEEQDRKIAEITRLRSEGAWDEAFDRIEDYLEQFPVSRHDENVRFWQGDCAYRNDQWVRAYEVWREFTLLHPVSDYSVDLTETLYMMGKDFLDGKRSSFFGIFSRREVGPRILNHLIESFPSSPRAADGQWLIAQFHLDAEAWPDAEAAFQFVIDQYGASEWYQPALYYVAYCQYRQVKGARYDPETMRKAKEGFEVYLSKASEGSWRTEAHDIALELEELRAAHVLTIAEWYIDQDKPYSARYYLMAVVTRFPQSEAAARAKALLPEVPISDAKTRPAGEGEQPGAKKTAGSGKET
jgi:outer membrane protein assembly factor BamD (BamD/ComL family)